MKKNNTITGVADFKFPIDLFTVEHLSKQIGIPSEILEIFCMKMNDPESAERLVRLFQVEKSSGGKRDIHDLDLCFKKINSSLDKLLKKVKLPDCFRWGVKGSNIKSNALLHIGNPYLYKMDISNFFPSITARRIREMLKAMGCSSQVASIITRLSTYNWIDPQGFPTACTIANIYLANTCHSAIKRVLWDSIAHSFWVDDGTFSSKSRIPHDKIGKIIGILARAWLVVHPRKSIMYWRNQSKEVTSLVIGDTDIKINPETIERMRSDLHLLRRFSPEELSLKRYEKNKKRQKAENSGTWMIKNLNGRLLHIKNTNEGQFNKISKAYADTIKKYEILIVANPEM